MGIWDKVKGMVNPPEEDDYYDDDEGYYDFEDEPAVQQPAQQTASYAQPVQSRQSSMGVVGGALEMKVVKPERFDEVRTIGEHLLARRTVVLNLEDTNKETTKRIIDFLCGVVFAIDGQVKKVANATYVVTPKNVDVSGDQTPDQPAEEANKPKELFR